MGNLEVKSKFENYNKEGCSKLSYTPEILFEEELVETVLKDMISKMNIDEPKWEELFVLTNVQKNDLEERHFEDALATHLSENYVAGF